jgi:hypothetical protein
VLNCPSCEFPNGAEPVESTDILDRGYMNLRAFSPHPCAHCSLLLIDSSLYVPPRAAFDGGGIVILPPGTFLDGIMFNGSIETAGMGLGHVDE